MNQHVDPAQLADTSAPIPASGEEPLTLYLADLRELNEAVGGVAASIKYDHRDFMDRTMMSDVGSSAFKLMAAITTRTLQFDKVAETIPQDQFINGLRKSNEEKTLAVDKYGRPIFKGTGMTRNPIREALKELSTVGLISSFTVVVPRTGPVTAYMPLSWRNLYISAAKYSGVLSRLFNIAKSNPAIFELMLKPPENELEANYGAQFYEGMGVVKTIKAMYGDDLRQYSEAAVCQRRYQEQERAQSEGQKLTLARGNF